VRRSKPSPLVGKQQQIQIHAMDLDAQGIGRIAQDDPDSPNKVVFVAGALPTEIVQYEITQVKSKFMKGKLREVIRPAVYRKTPPCPWFGNCGGCTMQHLDARAQLAMKQRVLEDDLKHLGKVSPMTLLSPIAGPDWHYRYRTRLSVVNRSIKKGTILVGFHEPQNRFVADMTSCEVLPQVWSDLLPALRELVMDLSIRDRIPQIELAMGDQTGSAQTAMVVRHLLPLSLADEERLIAFAEQHNIWIWLQAQGPESVKPFYPKEGELFYLLPEFGLQIPFEPTDFTQINHLMNQVLVGRAVRMLEIAPEERLLDLFCGIGNFTLPMATLAKEVWGIEGSEVLCRRAKANAIKNGIQTPMEFRCLNLFSVTLDDMLAWGAFDKWLIDPPRDGAYAVVQALRDAFTSGKQAFTPQRIVYVSCNPATLARDAGVLVNEAGYELSQAGIMNMFPHTSHVESIAVFNRRKV
jgi:23S rRNA (uracil1939-C5)-methyltransferase